MKYTWRAVVRRFGRRFGYESCEIDLKSYRREQSLVDGECCGTVTCVVTCISIGVDTVSINSHGVQLDMH